MPNMTLSETGAQLITSFEQLRLEAYVPTVKDVPTIGWGHTKGVTLDMVITREQAIDYFKQDVQWAENVVNRSVKVELTQNQFDALVSFAFNVGAGAFKSSTLVQRLNAGYYEAVPEELDKWVYQGLDRINGLVTRRKQEAAMWNSKENLAHCFLADTPILMADGSEKPIQDIRPGDMVMAFDPKANNGLGDRQPARVRRTFQNVTKSIIDLRGLRMTPGHVVLSDNGEWLKVMDVLRRDRAMVEERKDGPVLVRARTGMVIGSEEDAPVTVLFADREGRPHKAVVRAGIICIAERRADGAGEGWSLARVLRHQNYTIHPDGTLTGADGRFYNATPWPGGTPLDAPFQENWVVSIDDRPYMPAWIAGLRDEDEAQAVNEVPAFAAARPFASNLNRKERRRLAALRLVKN